jgi:hypothetical protein
MAKQNLMHPDNMTGGGFSFRPGYYLLNLVEYAVHQAKDKDGKPFPGSKENTCLHLNMTQLDDDGKTKSKDDKGQQIVRDQWLSAGEAVNFVPSEDDETVSKTNVGSFVILHPRSSKKGLWKESKASIFITNLLNCGYDIDRLCKYGVYGLNGAVVKLREDPYAPDLPEETTNTKLAGAEDAKATAARRRMDKQTVVVPEDIEHSTLADDKKIKAGKAVERTTTAAAGGKTNGRAVDHAADSGSDGGDSGGSDDADDLAVNLIDEIMTAKGKDQDSVMLALIRGAVTKAVADQNDSVKTAVIAAVKDLNKLGALLNNVGWRIDGPNAVKGKS